MLDDVKFWDLLKFCFCKLVPAFIISLFAWNLVLGIFAGLISLL